MVLIHNGPTSVWSGNQKRWNIFTVFLLLCVKCTARWCGFLNAIIYSKSSFDQLDVCVCVHAVRRLVRHKGIHKIQTHIHRKWSEKYIYALDRLCVCAWTNGKYIKPESNELYCVEKRIRWLVVELSEVHTAQQTIDQQKQKGQRNGNVWFIKEAADIHQKVAYKYICIKRTALIDIELAVWLRTSSTVVRCSGNK